MGSTQRLLLTAASAIALSSLFSAHASAQGYVFTTCGGDGAFGPTQEMCDAAYNGTPLHHAVIVERGTQTWSVPVSGLYRITAIGAQGASAQIGFQGGRGAQLTGEFFLIAGTRLRVVVGQVGSKTTMSGAGGGGSFVVEAPDNPLLVAGGGGGTRMQANQNGCDASITTFGIIGGSFSSSSCAVKTIDNGRGGRFSFSWGSAGGGFFGDGASDAPFGEGGRSWANGMRGGATGDGCGRALAPGGFGGGGTGNGCFGGGGGGGYSGGDGGFIAGGGGSFNIGRNPVAVRGAGVGNGSVSIELFDTTAPRILFNLVPPTLTNNPTAEFAFSTNEPATLECHLDGGTPVSCNTAADRGSIVYSGLEDGPHTFGITATDAALNRSRSQYTWTIDTQAPRFVSVDALPNPSPVNTAITLGAVWSDATTAWYSIDDGPFTEMSLNGETFIADLGAFTEAAVHNVCVRASDTAGNSAGDHCFLVAVYDPTAGFATGGGWFNSPAGAFFADPSLTGKVTFGFASKYLKDATVPTGSTRFQLHFAGISFKGRTYDWLVLSDTHVQYKGLGTINGAGEYEFMLTAIDGTASDDGRERIGMKIWDPVTGLVIYENDPTTALGGGSIVTHTGQN
jgi:hypothetical protein